MCESLAGQGLGTQACVYNPALIKLLLSHYLPASMCANIAEEQAECGTGLTDCDGSRYYDVVHVLQSMHNPLISYTAVHGPITVVQNM